MYLCIGRIIALSILHGVPGPTFFAPIVVDYLFGGFQVKPCIEDVPDNELQLKINKSSLTRMLFPFLPLNVFLCFYSLLVPPMKNLSI
jgi:hypothetical protein